MLFHIFLYYDFSTYNYSGNPDPGDSAFPHLSLVLEYADIVWNNCTLHESNLLESVQFEAGKNLHRIKNTIL
jgi:hypothetical protein